MDDSWLQGIYLESEQQELFDWMIEGERELTPDKRGPFLLASTHGGSFLIHSAIRERPEVNRGDLDTLVENGLLRLGFGSQGTPNFTITPLGRRYYAEAKRQSGEAVETIEVHIQRFLQADDFQDSFPGAYQRWRQAADDLWGAEDEGQFTQIGHICREAMQAFAANLADKGGGADVPADPAKTVARIRTVLAASDLGDSHADFLDALLAYWGTVSDLVQRQEHGAQKEGTPLTWEDARRVVFQTAVVMYEIARIV